MLNLPSLPQLTANITNNQPLLAKLPLQFKAHLIEVMPKILRPSLRLLPFRAQKAVLLPALTSVFREALADGDFEFLQGKWLKIVITDLELTWWLSFDDNKLVMASKDEMAANSIHEDVSFSATGDDLVLIAGRKQDPDTLFFQRRLHQIQQLQQILHFPLGLNLFRTFGDLSLTYQLRVLKFLCDRLIFYQLLSSQNLS